MTNASPAPAVVLLHGMGADEYDLLPLARQLPGNAIYISVRAPLPFEWGGATWHRISEDIQPDPETFRKSFDLLQRFLSQAKSTYPIDPDRLYLLGFSMGAGMAVATVLRDPSSVAGIAALSGYLPEDVGIDYDWKDIAGKPIFIGHGSVDPLVPPDRSHRMSSLLTEAGADVSFHEYPMGHSISEDEFQDLVAWLGPKLTG
jgi:phospholipase/carboxylesterase